MYPALFRDDDDYNDDGRDEGWRNSDNEKRKRTGNQGGEAEILMQFSTLVGMGLIVRAGAALGGGDALENRGGSIYSRWRGGVRFDQLQDTEGMRPRLDRKRIRGGHSGMWSIRIP